MAKRPTKCISVSAAKVMHAKWISTRATPIAEAIGSEDTRDFVYSVAELQEFLDYVKDESVKLGVDNPGVRIYFAAYSADDSNKATVFLSATNGSDSNSPNNYDIDPFNVGTGGWPPNVY
ncbi:hypothetical protein [Constantimarinum furrinae]|uniref:Uncharacterized protein n=1 Tax=Constantimarinum furrinae TaxID=2562285 RepID=A0A7G8PXF2_9FLAO|nr:hypothetical protein [Constantimarinum furrinae]QNJ99018.1 hypothetical protein ALE3EI_2482 [Constantimarinum furrinae]